MSVMRKAAAATATLAVLGAGLVAGPASPASAKTIKACYNKKSGQVIVKKGRCGKGWKRLKWNVQGPQGPQGQQGPAGPQLSVKDKNGKALGAFMGYYTYGSNPIVLVLIDGGLFAYGQDGRLQTAGTVTFTTATCTGTPYLPASTEQAPNYLRTVGSNGRAVVRSTSPTYGPAQAFALTSTSTNVAATPLYYLNSAGACVSYGAPFTGVLIAWQTTAAPADVDSPLTVG